MIFFLILTIFAIYLFKVLHFSPALYSYVTKTLHKSMIVVINKIDLAPRALTVAWKHYLLTKFPELKIVLFSSNPSEAAYAKGGELQQQRRGTLANVLYLYYLVIFLVPVFCMMIEPKV